jgi:hypothetical protein
VAAPIPVKSYAFFSLQKFFSCYETQQLILGTGTAIWWVTEPHYQITIFGFANAYKMSLSII